MHNLDTPSLAAICIALQAISRRGLPVALVGAGLPDLQVRLISAKPYADRLFQYHELGRLPDPAARAALIGPAATLGVAYDEDAARQVVAEAAGYPYFLQEYGLELWNHAEESPIDLDDLETVREIVQDNLARSFFGTRFQMATTPSSATSPRWPPPGTRLTASARSRPTTAPATNAATAGAGWQRATRPRELAAARRAMTSLDPGPWDSALGEEADDLSSTLAAAPVMAQATRLPQRPRGKTREARGTLVGHAVEEDGRREPVRLRWRDRAGNVFVAGATGSGKTTLFGHLVAEDLRRGRALALLDFHDLARHALALVPPSRRREVVYVDAASREMAVVDLIPPDEHLDAEVVVAKLQDAFQEVWDPRGKREWIGPFFQHLLGRAYEALRTSSAFAGLVTLASIERLLSDPDFRGRVIDGIPDRALREQLVQYGRRVQGSREYNDLAYVTSKLSALTASRARHALAAPARYSMEELVATGGILIARVPVGELGVSVARLVRALLLSRIVGALNAQSGKPEHARTEVRGRRRGAARLAGLGSRAAPGAGAKAWSARGARNSASVGARGHPRGRADQYRHRRALSPVGEGIGSVRRPRRSGSRGDRPTASPAPAVLVRADGPPVVMRTARPLADDESARERTLGESLQRFQATPVAVEAGEVEPDSNAGDDDLDLDDLLAEVDPIDRTAPASYHLALLLGPGQGGEGKDHSQPGAGKRRASSRAAGGRSRRAAIRISWSCGGRR